MPSVIQLKTDLNSLQAQERTQRTLSPVDAKGVRPATRSTGVNTPQKTKQQTGGIASPLVERTRLESGKQVPDRDYYPDGLTSSDGLLILPAIKTMRMTDANGATVEFQLANPKGTV